MLRFKDDAARKRIDLGDGDWVEVPTVLTSEDAGRLYDLKGDPCAYAHSGILGWNLKGTDGKDAEPTLENVRRLDVNVVAKINDALIEMLSFPKEKSPGSVPQSGTEGAATS